MMIYSPVGLAELRVLLLHLRNWLQELQCQLEHPEGGLPIASWLDAPSDRPDWSDTLRYRIEADAERARRHLARFGVGEVAPGVPTADQLQLVLSGLAADAVRLLDRPDLLTMTSEDRPPGDRLVGEWVTTGVATLARIIEAIRVHQEALPELLRSPLPGMPTLPAGWAEPPPLAPPPPPTHAPDFSTIVWGGVTYQIPARGREPMRLLWEGWEHGRHGVAAAALLEASHSEGSRVRDLFTSGRGELPVWRKVIESDPGQKGVFRLRVE